MSDLHPGLKMCIAVVETAGLVVIHDDDATADVLAGLLRLIYGEGSGFDPAAPTFPRDARTIMALLRERRAE